MALIYTRQTSGKKKKRKQTKKMQLAIQEHIEFLKKYEVLNIRKDNTTVLYDLPDLTVKQVAKTSDNLYVNGGYKRRIDDYKWKRGAEEKPETIKAIEDRQKRVAILYNKGGYQLITGDVNPINIGRK